jgi:polar amino acid transport system substrate-binding protein
VALKDFNKVSGCSRRRCGIRSAIGTAGIDQQPTVKAAVSARVTSRSFETRRQSAEMRRSMTARRSVLRSAVLPLLPALLWRGASARAQSAEDEPVRILFDVQENPPLICGTGTAIDPIRPGLTIEMLRMAAELAHIPLEFSRTPWERGLYLIETGQGDAIFATSFVEARTRYGVYPMHAGQLDRRRKLFDQSYRLYVRVGSGVGWDGKTLSNLHAPVGATTGYAVVPVLRAMGVAVEEEPSHIANLRKLAAGRLDAYAELDAHVPPLLRNNNAEFAGIVALSPPVLTKPYFLMFSKIFYDKTPAIAERIWDAIASVNASSAYQDLLLSAKYGE